MRDLAEDLLVTIAVAIAALWLTSCSSGLEEPCSPEAAEAIMVGARAAVNHLIDSGACPVAEYPDVVDCPAYQSVRSVAKKALEEGACR